MEVRKKIELALKKKKESVVFDLYLRDYDRSNFYFALVFNKNIEKFKVLFVPIDAIDDEDEVEEYFCYQFIFIETVNYLLEIIDENEDKYKEEEFRNRKVPTMDSYYIEMNTHVKSKDYKFMFTQYLDKDYEFFFDLIAVLFEHLPNIVSELCPKLLVAFSSNEILKYDGSFEFDLYKDSLDNIIEKEVIKKCKYRESDISFLENVGNRYYAVMNDRVIVIDYFNGKKILNINSGGFDILGSEIYIILKAIKDEKFHDFYRLKVIDGEDEYLKREVDRYYLCYGIEDDYFKVIDLENDNKLDLSIVSHEKVKIMNSDKKLEKELREYLSVKYEDFRVEEILNFVIVK